MQPDNVVPTEIASQIERAIHSGRWMVAVWRIDEANQMHCDRTAMNMPRGDIDLAMRLIVENCEEMKNPIATE